MINCVILQSRGTGLSHLFITYLGDLTGRRSCGVREEVLFGGREEEARIIRRSVVTQAFIFCGLLKHMCHAYAASVVTALASLQRLLLYRRKRRRLVCLYF